jgi:hypothetical protein
MYSSFLEFSSLFLIQIAVFRFSLEIWLFCLGFIFGRGVGPRRLGQTARLKSIMQRLERSFESILARFRVSIFLEGFSVIYAMTLIPGMG